MVYFEENADLNLEKSLHHVLAFSLNLHSPSPPTLNSFFSSTKWFKFSAIQRGKTSLFHAWLENCIIYLIMGIRLTQFRVARSLCPNRKCWLILSLRIDLVWKNCSNPDLAGHHHFGFSITTLFRSLKSFFINFFGLSQIFFFLHLFRGDIHQN